MVQSKNVLPDDVLLVLSLYCQCLNLVPISVTPPYPLLEFSRHLHIVVIHNKYLDILEV